MTNNHTIGNHDMDAYTPDEYVAGMKMPGRYYSFDKGDFHFIVLDGNNLYDGKKYTHYSKANYYVNPKMRAFVDPEQMEWLKKTWNRPIRSVSSSLTKVSITFMNTVKKYMHSLPEKTSVPDSKGGIGLQRTQSQQLYKENRRYHLCADKQCIVCMDRQTLANRETLSGGNQQTLSYPELFHDL